MAGGIYYHCYLDFVDDSALYYYFLMYYLSKALIYYIEQPFNFLLLSSRILFLSYIIGWWISDSYFSSIFSCLLFSLATDLYLFIDYNLYYRSFCLLFIFSSIFIFICLYFSIRLAYSSSFLFSYYFLIVDYFLEVSYSNFNFLFCSLTFLTLFIL